ncbi:hypothetical protein [Niallia sp. Marseille-Q9988]
MFDKKRMIEEMIKFDDSFPDGIFAISCRTGEPKVKVRALWDFCQKKGLKPSQLSSGEMELFLDY